MIPLFHRPARSVIGSLLIIGAIIGGSAAAFAFTAGWLSSKRLTPQKMLVALAPADGPALGRRRNHAKGICFTGFFEASGNGAAILSSSLVMRGRYPALGRFNLGTADPNATDATVRVRGMSLRLASPGGQEWRMAMIDPPFFPVSNPRAFHDMLIASASKDPDAMKAFIASNPEYGAFAEWAKTAPFTSSYAEERYNSLDSFVFTDDYGVNHTVRWSFLPAATPTLLSSDELAKRGPDFLEQEISARVRTGPPHWTMIATVANPGDPTSDPSRAWPEDRRTVEIGTLVVQRTEPEADGPCRDINFDPTVLPSGIKPSDDPFPAARSSVYRVSYDLRTSEAKDYPRTDPGANK
ncbi:catalase family peroxidase [Bradyrhizobium elkanii]|uniref:catalase family peroxidase n=1 Tax=Bradyrhizobium elkanii TaxID=29448 RepID=UPI00216A4078|nr:catalase family peroxidase [Bradyrhizobium elkanii]MCS3522203.1 catalase [Bradyrhizobium elkanii]MCS4069857.1 catalase [Bradyrhizobium elkanii]MCS4076488.1 catalase [Bradyrhizobium elkanii]MCW2124954.1 catalase [Bradyrhizobium elkanii]MCW2171700.1 catalase [Bradyrhizobium elkanii]